MENWSKAIKEMMEKSIQDSIDFNESLPEPNSKYFIEEEEYGYWVDSDNGVTRIRKNKNGYKQSTCIYFTNEEINAINRAREK